MAHRPALPVGPTTGQFGQVRVPAKATRSRASRKAMTTPATSGRISSGSSASVALTASLASKLATRFAMVRLDGISADLEGAGYAVGATVLGAHSVNAPHIRQRLYWVAQSGRAERGGRGEPARKHGGALHAANGSGLGGLPDASSNRHKGAESTGGTEADLRQRLAEHGAIPDGPPRTSPTGAAEWTRAADRWPETPERTNTTRQGTRMQPG